MIYAFGALAVLLCWLWWKRHKRITAPGPLAGYDTGVRSAYRTPARFFHNRRTL